MYVGFSLSTIANDITATLGPRGIPVHRPFYHEGSVARLHRHRDLIALVAVASMEHMLLHHRHHVHRVAAVSHHLHRKGVDRAHPIGDRHIHRFGGGRRVLDGQPLVIAQVGVAFREAVVAVQMNSKPSRF